MQSVAGFAGSNPDWGMDLSPEFRVLSAVSALGRSLVQRSHTGCGVSECDREGSKMRRPWFTGGRCATEKKAHSTICVFVVFFKHRDTDTLHRLVVSAKKC